MKFHTTGNGNGLNDLYILPENTVQAGKIAAYLKSVGVDYRHVQSDVEGQDWYGKMMIIAAFAECRQKEIEALFEKGAVA